MTSIDTTGDEQILPRRLVRSARAVVRGVK